MMVNLKVDHELFEKNSNDGGESSDGYGLDGTEIIDVRNVKQQDGVEGGADD